MIGGVRVPTPNNYDPNRGQPDPKHYVYDPVTGRYGPRPTYPTPPNPTPPSIRDLTGGGGALGGGTVTPKVDPYAKQKADHQRYLDERAARQKTAVEQAYQDKIRTETNTREDAKRKEILDRIDREMAAGRAGAPGAGGAPGAAPTVGATEQDARAAAFSRAKDQAGRIARSSLTQIAEQVASRGMSGASVQALQEAGAIGNAEGTLQDLTRDQMISDVNRSGQVADRDYAGQLAMRGQDMQNRQSYLSLLRGLY